MKLFLQLLILMPWRVPEFLYDKIRYRIRLFLSRRGLKKCERGLALMQEATNLFERGQREKARRKVRKALGVMDKTGRSQTLKVFEEAGIDIWARDAK